MSIDSVNYFLKNHKSPTIQNVAKGEHSQNRISEQQELDEEEIVMEIDRILTEFQHKIINTNEEIEGDCYKNDRNNDIIEPKAKIKAKQKRVGKKLFHHTFPPIVNRLCPNKNCDDEVVVDQEKPQDCFINIGGVENTTETRESMDKSTLTNIEGDILDKEEYGPDDITSETCSSISSVVSYDKKDEEELVNERLTNVNMAKENYPISTGSTKEKLPTIKLSDNKEKAGTKISDSDKKLLSEVGSSPDDECSKNGIEEKTRVKNSAVLDLKEFQIIVVDSSSGESSDEENNTNNENEKSDDDVILIENKYEPIVIDSSDEEEEGGEKSFHQEGSHHEQFKIILLNTKEGDKDFLMVDSGAIKTEPRVVVFDK